MVLDFVLLSKRGCVLTRFSSSWAPAWPWYWLWVSKCLPCWPRLPSDLSLKRAPSWSFVPTTAPRFTDVEPPDTAVSISTSSIFSHDGSLGLPINSIVGTRCAANYHAGQKYCQNILQIFSFEFVISTQFQNCRKKSFSELVVGNFENSKLFECLVILKKKKGKVKTTHLHTEHIVSLFSSLSSWSSLGLLIFSYLDPVLSFVLSSLVFSLSLSPCVVVCCALCCGVCAVWCVVRHTWKKPCVDSTSPCVPAPRPHVVTHVRVVPVHTGTFWTYTRGRFESAHGGMREREGEEGEKKGQSDPASNQQIRQHKGDGYGIRRHSNNPQKPTTATATARNNTENRAQHNARQSTTNDARHTTRHGTTQQTNTNTMTHTRTWKWKCICICLCICICISVSFSISILK